MELLHRLNDIRGTKKDIAATADDATVIDAVGRNQARAWPRYWSRLCDVYILSIPVGILVGLLFPAFATSNAFNGSGGSLALSIVLMSVVMLFDAACLALFGNTPARALAGIRVETLQRKKLSFAQAMHRNGLVYLKGLALGIPLVSLITISKSYNDLKLTGQTSWDTDLSTRVYDRHSSVLRTTLVAFLFLVLVFAGQLIDKMDQQDGLGVQTAGSQSDAVAQQLAKVAATLKPSVVDNITRLEGATSEGRTFIYLYSISSAQVTEALLASNFQTTVMPAICSNGDLRNDMKDYQVTYRYRYTLPNRTEPVDHDVNWIDCQKLGH